jgi:hypothetical protein
MENYEIINYILDDDDNLDLLTQDLLDVERKEDTNLVKNERLFIQDKKEIIIEININSLDDENELDFIDNDFEYIDEDYDEDEENEENEDEENEENEDEDNEDEDEENKNKYDENDVDDDSEDGNEANFNNKK